MFKIHKYHCAKAVFGKNNAGADNADGVQLTLLETAGNYNKNLCQDNKIPPAQVKKEFADLDEIGL